MGIFRADTTAKRLEERIAALETVNDDSQRTIRRLELEYIELYDKVRHQMSRMAKRYAPDTAGIIQEDAAAADVDGVDEISARIIAMRGRPRSN